jgi:hypothetical protein
MKGIYQDAEPQSAVIAVSTRSIQLRKTRRNSSVEVLFEISATASRRVMSWGISCPIGQYSTQYVKFQPSKPFTAWENRFSLVENKIFILKGPIVFEQSILSQALKISLFCRHSFFKPPFSIVLNFFNAYFVGYKLLKYYPSKHIKVRGRHICWLMWMRETRQWVILENVSCHSWIVSRGIVSINHQFFCLGLHPDGKKLWSKGTKF